MSKQRFEVIIQSCTVEEIAEMYELLNIRRRVLDSEARHLFKLHEDVKFDAGRRGIIHGFITEFCRNGKVKVQQKVGLTRWKVSGSLLRKVTDTRPPPKELPASGDAGGDEF